ncbi:MAG: DUF4124 domain-containing protein [Halothiobacillaceae bacterium]|nr:DUF4124 domain-containing protein [Halothiobacillaceae bacterium]
MTIALAALLLAGTPATGIAAERATVYKCTHSDGRVVYSDAPCNGNMEVQTITAPEAGRGGEAAREGIDRLAREYDQRREAERQAERKAAERARDQARRDALDDRLANPDITVVTPWSGSSAYPHYPLVPYERYRSRTGGGARLNDDGLSLWFGEHYPTPRHDRGHRRQRKDGDHRPPRHPYSVDGQPIKEPGYSGRYPGGFPGYQ